MKSMPIEIVDYSSKVQKHMALRKLKLQSIWNIAHKNNSSAPVAAYAKARALDVKSIFQ